MNWTPLIATLAATAFIIGRFPFHKPALSRKVSRRINDRVLRSEPKLKVSHRVYIFANPISGSNKARVYLEVGQDDFWVKLDSTCAKVCIFNVLDRQQTELVFAKLEEDLQANNQAILVMMGGDGGLTNALLRIKQNPNLLAKI